MIFYHEASAEAFSSILKDGLKCTSRGAKGNEQSIIKTDELLDKRRTEQLLSKGISRDNNLYAYIGTDANIIDITSGKIIDIEQYTQMRRGHLFRLDVDQKRCYVSNLDAYDRLRQGVENKLPQQTLNQWADEYWSEVIPLNKYHVGLIRRPEVMITSDIPAERIYPVRM